jgi:hypothetical protein
MTNKSNSINFDADKNVNVSKNVNKKRKKTQLDQKKKNIIIIVTIIIIVIIIFIFIIALFIYYKKTRSPTSLSVNSDSGDNKNDSIDDDSGGGGGGGSGGGGGGGGSGGGGGGGGSDNSTSPPPYTGGINGVNSAGCPYYTVLNDSALYYNTDAVDPSLLTVADIDVCANQCESRGGLYAIYDSLSSVDNCQIFNLRKRDGVILSRVLQIDSSNNSCPTYSVTNNISPVGADFGEKSSNEIVGATNLADATTMAQNYCENVPEWGNWMIYSYVYPGTTTPTKYYVACAQDKYQPGSSLLIPTQR